MTTTTPTTINMINYYIMEYQPSIIEHLTSEDIDEYNKKCDSLTKNNPFSKLDKLNLSFLSNKNKINKVLDKKEHSNKIQMYLDNGCDDTILRLIKYNSTPSQFGHLMEDIIKTVFGADDSLNKGHDLIYKGKKIELKSSRIKNDYLINGKKIYQYDCIRPYEDYDYIMICNINFDELKYYIISKEKFLSLGLGKNQKRFKENNVISTSFKKIKDHITEITPKTIDKYLENN